MSDDPNDSPEYANKNIPPFLKLPSIDTSLSRSPSGFIQTNLVQIVDNGGLLTADNFKAGTLSIRHPVLVRDRPESIGMQLPSPSMNKTKRAAMKDQRVFDTVTVRDIADVVGYSHIVHVIDVEYQEEMEGWTFADLVDYFEDEDRIISVAAIKKEPERTRPSRRSASKYIQKTRHRVLNQISFEFSQTPLRAYVKSPSFVRDMDWIDHAWPSEHRSASNKYPMVQYYCLTSAAGSYTDFHVDFGGTSVWYHVLSGSKDFCLIVPSEQNLRIYEEWLGDPDQAHIFLADRIPDRSEVLRIPLKQNQTMIIPAGWIHCVYTPDDSLVFGGNFLHGMDIDLQLRIYAIELRSKLVERFRFPFFKPLHFYAGGMYLRMLMEGTICARELEELPYLVTALKDWWNGKSDEGEMDKLATVKGAAECTAQQHGCSSVEDFLDKLQQQIDRVVANGISPDKVSSQMTPLPEKSSKEASPTPKKIRLRIAQPKAGSDTQVTSSSSRGDDTTNEFRIKLSSKSLRPEPLPSHVRVSRSQPREDMSSFVDERELLKDDEWVPSRSEQVDEHRKGRKDFTSNNTTPRKNKRIKVSGRERLLKKLK